MIAGVTRNQWHTLFAAQLGWLLDGMDVMLYAFALTAIQQEFLISSAAAGTLVSVTLVMSAIGGGFAGVLADRFGRRVVLIGSILTYSVFTAAMATASTVTELLIWRSLVGLGLGAEWSAGAVLVAEAWPPEHRGKASGIMQAGWPLGYIAAALLSAAVLPTWGWRPLFAIGVAPALLTLWIRSSVPESPLWTRGTTSRFSLTPLLHAPLRTRAIIATAMCGSLLFAYWGLFSWIPTFLAAPVERGGAGLDIVRSTGWVVSMQMGAVIGCVGFGFVADRVGRRSTFIAYVLAAAVLVPVYGLLARDPILLLLLSPLIGCFGAGYFAVFGALLAELFPLPIRATAQGLCYNSGRAVSALAPVLIGYVADRRGFGSGLALTSCFFFAGAVLMLKLPETKGVELT